MKEEKNYKKRNRKKIFLYERIRYQENMYKQYVRLDRKKINSEMILFYQ